MTYEKSKGSQARVYAPASADDPAGFLLTLMGRDVWVVFRLHTFQRTKIADTLQTERNTWEGFIEYDKEGGTRRESLISRSFSATQFRKYSETCFFGLHLKSVNKCSKGR